MSWQGTPVTADALVTLADMKTWLGVSGTSEDTEIQDMLLSVTRILEREAGRHLLSTTSTVILDGMGTANLWLPEGAESVTSVHESTSQDWTDAYLTDSDDYVLLPNEGIHRMRLYKPSGFWLHADACVRAVFAAGFATVPADLKDAVKTEVPRVYQAWKAAKQGHNILKSVRVETWSLDFLEHDGLDKRTREIINQYVPPRF